MSMSAVPICCDWKMRPKATSPVPIVMLDGLYRCALTARRGRASALNRRARKAKWDDDHHGEEEEGTDR